MKLSTLVVSLGFLLFIAGLFVLYLGEIHASNNIDPNGKCYDKFENQINGVTCKVGDWGYYPSISVILVFLGFTVGGIGALQMTKEADKGDEEIWGYGIEDRGEK